MQLPSTAYPYLSLLTSVMPYPVSLRSPRRWPQTSNLAWSSVVLRCVGRSTRPYCVP